MSFCGNRLEWKYIICIFAQNFTYNIICKMEYNIVSAINYLEELTGYKTRRIEHAISDDDKLPLAIATYYSFYDLEFMETQVTIAVPLGIDGITPMQLAKHKAKMIEAFRHPVIFVLENVASYQIARLTRAKVDFIVPGKIIFIPSMLTVLREIKNTVKEMPEKMPPATQMLVLYHLETKTINGLTASDIAGLTGLAYPTVNIALRWLVANEIISLVGSKQKHVQLTMSKEELWDKSSPMMSSPIQRILFTDTKPEGSLMSGETAMGHYTMLAEPATPVIAIDKATAKANATLMNKEYGSIMVEVWKYSPSLLSENEWADRLSLYLSMKDSEDERIQMECDTLIGEMKW